MYRGGITGTIASGKTSVSILLRRRGFRVFNSDQYAHTALHQGSACFDDLVRILSEEVLDCGGDIDRHKMAEKIFHDEELRQKVNQIVHPYVRKGLISFFSHQNDPIAFAEVPLLYEAGWENLFDEVCVVTCTKETAVQRMMRDRDYTMEEAESRYDSQLRREDQIEKADRVIYNDGTLKELDHKVEKWIQDIERKQK